MALASGGLHGSPSAGRGALSGRRPPSDPAQKAHCRLAARGAGLADGPEREGHARQEGVPGVRGQGGVGGGVGRHGAVAQRGRVDVGVEAGGERGVR